ncbi:MAG: sulfotransferase [Proteobacteria bacterium]|nr:sulfotransferase [Pseudomonadota bacterium]
MYKHFFGAGGYRYAYEQTELGKYYRGYEDLMVHWHDVLPSVVHDVRYEDLIQNQENTTRALLDACDLPWGPGMPEFPYNTAKRAYAQRVPGTHAHLRQIHRQLKKC